MTKRRRERDRPKGGPDSHYDPNKRVLLSYDSDDEGETSLNGASAAVTSEDSLGAKRAEDKQQNREATSATKAQPSGPPMTATASFASGAKLDKDGKTVSSDKPSIPSPVHGSALEDDEDDYDPASAFQSSEAEFSKTGKAERKGNAYPSKNATTNQKPALGSLSYQYEGDEEDDGWESAEDEAMAYLRAVRTERQTMPVVLRATAEDEEEDLYELGDSRGYIEEDCYIARPVAGPQAPRVTTISAMQAYTDALKTRFLNTRASFNNMPPPGSAASTETERPIPRPRGGHPTYGEALRLVRDTAPSPSQVHAMEQHSVLTTLELVQKHFFQRGKHLNRNLSAWIWALLARLEDVGMMNNDKVSVLRELGKRAVIIQISLNDAATAAQLEEVGQDEVTKGPEDDITAKEAIEQEAGKPLGEADITEPSQASATNKDNTLATLDMVLAIVGELFGQRDLLEFRRSWEPEAHVTAESEALYGS